MFRDPFRDDPFFNMSDMNMALGENMMIPHGNSTRRDNRSLARRNEFDIFSGFGSHFPNIQGQIQDSFNSLNSFNSQNFGNGNGATYSSSTVFSYVADGSGNEPQIYQAHKSVKQGPGGIREEQLAERDSRRKQEKMSIGRYIGERGKKSERKRNIQTGEREENNEYYEMGESDDEQFNNEWASTANQVFDYRGICNYRENDFNARQGSHAAIGTNKKGKGKGSKKNTGAAALEITDGSTKGRSRRHH